MKARRVSFLAIVIVGIVLICILLLLLGPALGPPILQVVDEYKNRAADPQRHLLFCERLKPGLTIEEVHEVISQFGTYQESSFTDPSQKTMLSVHFDNSSVRDKFGGDFVLIFKYEAYEKAMYFKRSAESSPSLVDYKCNN